MELATGESCLGLTKKTSASDRFITRSSTPEQVFCFLRHLIIWADEAAK